MDQTGIGQLRLRAIIKPSGRDSLSFRFHIIAYLKVLHSIQSKSGRTPFEFDALLLFALPLLFTFAKFVEFTTSRSHQFARSKIAPYFIE